METIVEHQIFKLLEKIGKLIKAIDDEVDWFLASIEENDPKRRILARFMSDKKREELARLTKEINEQYKQ